MKTLITLGIIIVLLLGVTVWLVQRGSSDAPSVEIVASPTGTTTQKVRFVSPQTNEVIDVTFAENVATLNGEGYQNLTLTQVEAASGARYESAAENVSVWNKGEEVTVYRGRQVIFIGQTEASLGNPNPAAEAITPVSATSTTSLVGNIWVWQSSTLSDGTTLTPNKPGVFTLEFNAEGNVRGTTDCNGFSGQYTQESSNVSSGPFAMTKMFCEGSQEMDFMNLVSGATTVSIEEGAPATLVITAAAGVSRLTQK
jgi:heat shock protein HslJ/membrane-bound inhibitor of C-type lysozyme